MTWGTKTAAFATALAIFACTLLPHPLGHTQTTSSLTQENTPPLQGGGWDALARLLEAAKPSVNTQLAPSAADITTHIETLINEGNAHIALAQIKQRLAYLAAHPPRSGTDIQLAFQHARALAALGYTQQALARYTTMTTRFPELPEPWNNLAALYAAQGQLNLARKALENALRAAPNDAIAQANLAVLQSRKPLRVSVKTSQH